MEDDTLVVALDDLSIATDELCPGCDRNVAFVLGDDGYELHVECDCGSAYALA